MDKKITSIKGRVISSSMNKTIVVAVDRLKAHPKYVKKYKSTKKYKVHDPENKYKIGDVIEFIQCRPISKEKRFKAL